MCTQFIPHLFALCKLPVYNFEISTSGQRVFCETAAWGGEGGTQRAERSSFLTSSSPCRGGGQATVVTTSASSPFSLLGSLSDNEDEKDNDEDVGVEMTSVSQHHRQHREMELKASVGYRPLYWQACLLCYVLGCASPQHVGAYAWEHLATVQTLML